MRKNILVLASFAFLVLVLFGISKAEATAYDEHMSKGKAFLEEKNYSEAAEEFRKAEKEDPEDQSAHLYLGIALNRMHDREAEDHLKKALFINPSDPRANLEMGVYYYDRRTYAEARDYLENARDMAPGSEYSIRAEKYLRELSGAAKEKPWSLGISIGEQYDTNVIVSSELPEGISRKSDWKTIIYLDGRVRFIKNEALEASFGYSFYQTLNYTLNDFNITQNLADVSFRYNLLPALSLGGMYKFEYILVGGDNYDLAHYVGPSIIISEGKGFSTELQYVYRYTTFKNGALFEENSQRSGPNHSVGIKQIIPIGSAVRAEVGYTFDKDLAQEDFWRYEGHKGYGSLNISLPLKFFISLYGEYYRKEYEAAFPSLSGSARKDEVQTYSISVTKLFTEHVALTLGETYVHNGSNIDVFDYNRSLTTLLATVRF